MNQMTLKTAIMIYLITIDRIVSNYKGPYPLKTARYNIYRINHLSEKLKGSL